MFRAIFIASAMGLSAGPALAIGLDIQFDPRLEVNAIDSTRFEIIEARGAGPADFWCAAGRYAYRTLGKTRGRVYIDTGRGPAVTAPGRKGVIFTIADPETPVQSYSLSITKPGFGLLIGAAIQYCRNYLIELEDLNP